MYFFNKEQKIFIVFVILSFLFGLFARERYKEMVKKEQKARGKLLNQVKTRLFLSEGNKLLETKDLSAFFRKDRSTNDNVEVKWIEVEIIGEVRRPGVYKVEEGTSFNRLLRIAGGFTKKVQKGIDYKNVLMKDGDSFHIPSGK